MIPTLSLTTIAIVIGAVIVAYSVWPKPTRPLPRIQSAATLRPANPGRELFDRVDDEARNRAGNVIFDRMAGAKADEHVGLIFRAFAPPATPPAPPPNA